MSVATFLQRTESVFLGYTDSLLEVWKSLVTFQGIKKKLTSGENIYLAAHIPKNLTMMSLHVKPWDSFTYLLPPSALYIIFPIASTTT